MANVSEQIQSSFASANEKSLAIMEVQSERPRKGKHKYIVITVTNAQPKTVQIHMVKYQEGSEMKPILLCTSNNIKKLDCRDSKTQPTYDLQLVTDYRSWNFRATNLETKSGFINTFCQLVSSLQPDVYKRIRITNLSSRVKLTPETMVSVEDMTKISDGNMLEAYPPGIPSPIETYRPLSQREEEDIKFFLDEFSSNSQQINATELTEMLQKQLDDMEGANIHTIMASENQVLKLMASLDAAIDQTERLESEMYAYHQFLADVEEAMSTLRDRDQLTQVTLDNRSRLLKVLGAIVCDLTLDAKYVLALTEHKLDSPSDIQRCTEAALYLDRLLNATSVPGREHLLSVNELTMDLKRLRDSFATELARRVSNQFVCFARQLRLALSSVPNVDLGESLADLANPSRASLSKISDLYRIQRDELLQFAPLIGGWLTANRKDILCELKREYIRQIHPFFSNRVADLFGRTQQVVNNLVKPPKGMMASDSGSMLSVRTAEGGGLIQVSNAMDDLFTKVRFLLNTEEIFFAKFFNMQEDDSLSEIHPDAIENRASCMASLFRDLERQSTDFITNCEDLQPNLVLPMLVVVSRQLGYEQAAKVEQAKSGIHYPSYSGFILSKLTMLTKRAFNRYIDQMIHSFREGKPSKKSRCGVIRIVRDYVEFAEASMVVFASSSRLVDLERAHGELVRALMAQLEYIASQTVKTPSEVVQLENYHRLCDIIRRLKMPGLDEYLQESKNRYTRALQEYTRNCMGRPLEKLATFFEGVQTALAAGIQPEVIQYQSAFSKHELRKVIQEYPGREVKRGLENLCKKVVKHLSTEMNLFQVVWRTIQAEFFDQYQLFNQLINECYPDSGFALEFTVDDLKKYFTDIAHQDNLMR